MNVSVSITGFDQFLETEIIGIKQAAQGAMAEKFFEITRENFGDEGIDRPSEWSALSPKYARRVGREHATLFVSGELEASIQLDNSNPEYSEVFTDNPYALVHQIGGGNNIPARPFMPIKGNPDDPQSTLTELAEREVLKAAEEAVNSRIK